MSYIAKEHFGYNYYTTFDFLLAYNLFFDNKWYKYNDAMVDYVGNFYNDIVNFGVPYILFYESQNQ